MYLSQNPKDYVTDYHLSATSCSKLQFSIEIMANRHVSIILLYFVVITESKCPCLQQKDLRDLFPLFPAMRSRMVGLLNTDGTLLSPESCHNTSQAFPGIHFHTWIKDKMSEASCQTMNTLGRISLP